MDDPRIFEDVKVLVQKEGVPISEQDFRMAHIVIGSDGKVLKNRLERINERSN